MKFSAFVDARRRVRDLRLKSKKEWIQYCRSDKKPKDIPANPVAVYNSQWHDWGDWLSTGTVAHQEEKEDLTLIDTCFRSELPKLEDYIKNVGCELKQIRRIILTHVHLDHSQATNELRKKVAEDVKVYAHWIDATYLSQNPSYHGPPSHKQIKELFENSGSKWKIWSRDLDQ